MKPQKSFLLEVQPLVCLVIPATHRARYAISVSISYLSFVFYIFLLTFFNPAVRLRHKR